MTMNHQPVPEKSVAVNKPAGTTSVVTRPAKEALIAMPGGPRRASDVRIVPRDHIVTATDGQLRVVAPSGAVLYDLGRVARRATNLPLPRIGTHPLTAARTERLVNTQPMTFAVWLNNASQPITSFRTTFRVPAPPTTDSDQTIFLYNGMENSDMALAPVLRWGSYGWTVQSCYVDGSALTTELVSVNVGDVLVGVIAHTGQSSTGHSYYCEFEGIPNTRLSVRNIGELRWCFEILETEGVTLQTDFPAALETAMTNIELRTAAGPATVSWTAINKPGRPQHTRVVSNASPGGEVDIYYHDRLAGKRLSAARNADGRLEAVMIGMDDALYHKKQLDPNSGWDETILLGGWAKDVVVGANEDGRLEAFYIGTNNIIYHNAETQPSRSWGGEAQLGGVAKQIALGQNANGRLELFYIREDDRLCHKWQVTPNGNWTIENTLAGWAKQIAVGCNADGRLELFYAGTNNRIYHCWQTQANGGWTGEEPMEGLAQQLCVGRQANGRLHLVYIGTNGHLYHNWQTASGWSGEHPMPGSGKQVVIGSNQDQRLEIFWIGDDDAIYHNWEVTAGGAWTIPNRLPGYAKRLALSQNADGRLELFYVGTDDRLYHNWQVDPNGGWTYEDTF